MSRLKRQAQYRTPVDLTGPPGAKGSPGADGQATVMTTSPVPVVSVFDPNNFMRLLVAYGRVLTGNGHALWGPMRT